MINSYFLYIFEIPSDRNPVGSLDRFREELRAYILSRGWQYGMGSLGGNFRVYGNIGGPNWDATEDDRQALANWVRQQPLCVTVKLGAVEPLDSEGQIHLRTITEWIFEVDNLSDVERAEATAHHDSMRRRIEELRNKPT